jgi:Na+(H+)/acetate symporter ActP
VLGHAKAVFPSDYPALIALPVTLAATWIVSILTRKDPLGMEIPQNGITDTEVAIRHDDCRV